MTSSGLFGHVALVRTDVSKKRIASIVTVIKIGELGTTLEVTSNRSTLRCIPPKRRFLQEPHGVIFQNTASHHFHRHGNLKYYKRKVSTTFWQEGRARDWEGTSVLDSRLRMRT
jgi:hypothetical protein